MLSNYTRTVDHTTAPAPRMNPSAEVLELKYRVESLELACAGLWELLKFKLGCTDEELIKAVEVVDGRDGEVDGKIRKAGDLCPSCGRQRLTRQSAKCAWCGGTLRASPL